VKRVLFHSAARAELDEAMAFYERRCKGLGLDLEKNVAQAVLAIQRSPESWPTLLRTKFQKYFVERFPFTVFYLDLPDRIWIVAIAHASRRPGYWDRREAE